ncbi:MAG: hypothetical protein ACP5OA_02620 [Candidatus Woesearchaeota archaeon]
MKNKLTDIILKTAKVAGICAMTYSCQPEKAMQPVKAESFQKGDSIIATDFGTYARIVSVKKLDDAKYETIIIGEGKVPGLVYQLTGKFDVELTSGNDDITNTPIIRFYKDIPGTVTLVDKDYSKK